MSTRSSLFFPSSSRLVHTHTTYTIYPLTPPPTFQQHSYATTIVFFYFYFFSAVHYYYYAYDDVTIYNVTCINNNNNMTYYTYARVYYRMTVGIIIWYLVERDLPAQWRWRRPSVFGAFGRINALRFHRRTNGLDFKRSIDTTHCARVCVGTTIIRPSNICVCVCVCSDRNAFRFQ